MSVPLATTLITVRRVALDTTRDFYDTPPAASTVASNVRAHISGPTGREQFIGGQQEAVDAELLCDPVDLQHTDTVVDQQDAGREYEVRWVRRRRGLGLDHMHAGLRQTTGEAA